MKSVSLPVGVGVELGASVKIVGLLMFIFARRRNRGDGIRGEELEAPVEKPAHGPVELRTDSEAQDSDVFKVAPVEITATSPSEMIAVETPAELDGCNELAVRERDEVDQDANLSTYTSPTSLCTNCQHAAQSRCLH